MVSFNFWENFIDSNKRIVMSENIENQKGFLRFVAINALTMSSIEGIYASHNVVYERVDLYKNFTLSLNRLIQDTYLGDDISDGKVKKQHFDWCWRKVCGDFEVMNIYFMDNQELYEYLKVFFINTFYNIPDKENARIIKNIENVWLYYFDYNNVKPHNDIDTFIEIYKKFELSFKNR